MILWAAVCSASSLVHLLFSGAKNLAVEAVQWLWAWLLLLTAWAQISPLPVIHCVTLDMSLNLSVPCFLVFKMEKE